MAENENRKKIVTVWIDKDINQRIERRVRSDITCSNKSDVIRQALDAFFEMEDEIYSLPTRTNINIVKV